MVAEALCVSDGQLERAREELCRAESELSRLINVKSSEDRVSRLEEYRRALETAIPHAEANATWMKILGFCSAHCW